MRLPNPVNVAVIDHGTGNLTSLVRALEKIGASPTRITSDAEQSGFGAAFLPGVGAFPTAMTALRANGWLDWIHEWVDSGKPLMGVCLGMQLLFDRSSEIDETEGLGLIAGEVTQLIAGEERLPHIGWSPITWTQPTVLSAKIHPTPAMYHVHSFVSRPVNGASVLATATHGEEFATAVWNGKNVFGVQFHPEKSSDEGLQLLSNFLQAEQE